MLPLREFNFSNGSFDVPFAERYKLIKRAGFDCVILWWSDKFGRGAGYQEDVHLAAEAGLKIENMQTMNGRVLVFAYRNGYKH